MDSIVGLLEKIKIKGHPTVFPGGGATLRFFGRRDDTRASLKHMLACLHSIVVNLLRYSEMRGFSQTSNDERELRMEMSLSDLRDFRGLSDEVRVSLSPPELTRSIDVIRSFAVISEVEGADFVRSNIDGIIRSSRWAISNIEKYSPVKLDNRSKRILGG